MNIFTQIIIKLIKGYKFLISPLLGQSCKFYPTCSDYSVDALKEFGLIKGMFLSLKRILSCNPWSHGGFDPAKKETKVKE